MIYEKETLKGLGGTIVLCLIFFAILYVASWSNPFKNKFYQRFEICVETGHTPEECGRMLYNRGDQYGQPFES